MPHKGPIARWSDLPYKSVLLLLLGIPMAAMAYFSWNLVSEKREVVREMQMLDDASYFVAGASSLVHEIQIERGYSSGFIASRGGNFRKELLEQYASTNEKYSDLLELWGALEKNGLPDGMRQNFKLIFYNLSKLKGKREEILSLKTGFAEEWRYYSHLNSILLDTIIRMPQLSSVRELSSYYLTSYYLQRLKENSSMQRGLLTYAFESDKFQPGQYEEFLMLMGDEPFLRGLFLSMASPTSKEAFMTMMDNPEVDKAGEMKKIAADRGSKGGFNVDANEWNAAQSKNINRMLSVSYSVERGLIDTVNGHLLDAKTSLRYYLSINISVFIFGAIMALLLFRNMSKRREAEERLGNHTKRMERALYRAKDVLDAVATLPHMIPFFCVSPVYRTMRSAGGGDIVKWLRFRSRYAALYVHDVAGHDIEEILLNILATSLVDIYKANPSKKSVSAPSVLLNEMNEHIRKYCEGTSDYLTSVYMLMDFEDREIRIASAGHPRPWLINTDGTAKQVDVPPGFILGQFEVTRHGKDRYSDIALRLEPGQLLLVYSDGLMEQSGDMKVAFDAKFRNGIAGKLGGLEPQDAYVRLKAEFEAHLGGRIPDDDVSFIFVGARPADKYKTMGFAPSELLASFLVDQKENVRGEAIDQRLVSMMLSWPEGRALAHSVVGEISEATAPIISALKDGGWEAKQVSAVELALEEMVMNALMHGNHCSARFRVEISYLLHSDVLEVCVSDEGFGFDSRALPQSINAEELLESGRGHHIISNAAGSLYFNEAGNRCWALFTKNSL